jgi:hypothetical protein
VPKRVVDGEGIWRSDKINRIQPVWMRAEYANLLPLALADGSFECNPRRIWSLVYSYNRPDITPADVEAIFNEFGRVGLVFRWWDVKTEKDWGYFIGIDKSGRLPPPKRVAEHHETTGEGNLPLEELKEYERATNGSQWSTNGRPGFGLGSGSGSGLGSGSRPPDKKETTPPQGGVVSKTLTEGSEEDLQSLDLEQQPQAAPANPEDYEGVDLRFSQDIVAWMRDAAGVCGKHWKHGGKRGNKGPHKAMESPIREKERFVGRRNFRSWWVDFLRSPQSDEPMYPYGAFLEGPYQVRLNQLPPDPADAPPEIPGANDPFV